MTNEITHTMNQVDTLADRALEISMRTDGPAGEVLKHYAERIMKISTETYKTLKKLNSHCGTGEKEDPPAISE